MFVLCLFGHHLIHNTASKSKRMKKAAKFAAFFDCDVLQLALLSVTWRYFTLLGDFCNRG